MFLSFDDLQVYVSLKVPQYVIWIHIFANNIVKIIFPVPYQNFSQLFWKSLMMFFPVTSLGMELVLFDG